MIKVSVIIVTYNAEKSIEKVIDSVLAQEGVNEEFTLELLVVDDCSTDSTAAILNRKNIPFISTGTNSGGPNKGRNIGLKAATGDYICLLDHDDLWEPQKIRLQLKAAAFAPIITCGNGTTNSYRGFHTSTAESGTDVKVYQENETFVKKLAREKKNIQNTYTSTIMIRNDLKHILFEEHFGMIDLDWGLKLLENQRTVEITQNLVTRFVDGKNLSLNKRYRKIDYYYALMCVEEYEQKYPKAVATAYKRINGSRGRYHYLIGEMKQARRYLFKAMPGIMETFYIITSFYGSRWVKKYFTVFG